jgi:hypothetical protein
MSIFRFLLGPVSEAVLAARRGGDVEMVLRAVEAYCRGDGRCCVGATRTVAR